MLDRMTVVPVEQRAETTWTPDLVEQLKQLREAGLSASQIGDRFGMTRNAVLGAARRYGLAAVSRNKRHKWTNHMVERLREARDVRRIPTAQIAEELGCTIAAIWHAARRFECERRYVSGGARRKYVEIIDSEIPQEQRRSILELSDDTCRWPVGEPGTPDFFFCGAKPLEGYPYCAGHTYRAHRETTR